MKLLIHIQICINIGGTLGVTVIIEIETGNPSSNYERNCLPFTCYPYTPLFVKIMNLRILPADIGK